MDDDTCPHCGHLWDNHDGSLNGMTRCDVCNCMWQPPRPEPEPETERDVLIARVADALWTALETQDIYVDRQMDMIDASGSGVNMHAVAAALIDQLGLT